MKKNGNTFVRLARYYYIIYKNKNYAREVDIIDSIIKRYIKSSPIQLLDMGCGTGEYLLLFAKKGYKTTGLDRSADMIRVARKKIKPFKESIKVFHGDGRSFRFNKKFHVVTALFDVLSYQLSNDDITVFLSNINDHLVNGGLLLFDCWYGPRVLQNKLHPRYMAYRQNKLTIHRYKESVFSINSNTVTIEHTLFIEKNTKLVEKIVERHAMRYFFYPELDFFLQSTGYRIKEWGLLHRYLRLPKSASWSVLFVAKKQ